MNQCVFLLARANNSISRFSSLTLYYPVIFMKIWETARRAGLITANLMWLGPWTTRTGIKSTYFVPWRDKVPMQEKHDQIMTWVDMPIETRPQLILGEL